MPIVYGPVPSWRLGRSLGIDPMPPPKTCIYDCIYCQLGPTRVKEFDPKAVVARVKPESLAIELSNYLERRGSAGIDYITFSGSGEPALNPHLGEMVRVVKEMVDVPVALLTSAGNFFLPEVREELLEFDVVVAKLDAPEERSFRLINRPQPEVRLDEIIEGLKEFRKDFKGIFATEVMLLKEDGLGLDTSKDEYLLALAELAKELGFDEVHLGTVIRPPAIPTVRRVSDNELLKAEGLFEELMPRHVAILSPLHPRPPKPYELKGIEGLKDEILSFLARRPSRAKGLSLGLGVPLEDVERALGELESEGLVSSYEYMGSVFYKPKLTNPSNPFK